MIAKENLQARQAKQGETGFGMGHTTSTKLCVYFLAESKDNVSSCYGIVNCIDVNTEKLWKLHKKIELLEKIAGKHTAFAKFQWFLWFLFIGLM